MRWQKIKTIILNEWGEVFKNRMVVFAVTFMPLLLTALPLFILHTMAVSGDIEGLSNIDVPAQAMQICGQLKGSDCANYFIVIQFMMMFMIMPVVIPVTIAAYSIVGEKTTHTLEPLLATPISTPELLVGKILAAMIPALLATWLGYAVFVIGSYVITKSGSMIAQLLSPIWLLAIFIVGTLLSVTSICIAVMVSSRVNDPRVAEQVSGLVALPVIGVLISQAAGWILINEEVIIWIAVGLSLINAGMLFVAIQLFQRETILTRWK